MRKILIIFFWFWLMQISRNLLNNKLWLISAVVSTCSAWIREGRSEKVTWKHPDWYNPSNQTGRTGGSVIDATGWSIHVHFTLLIRSAAAAGLSRPRSLPWLPQTEPRLRPLLNPGNTAAWITSAPWPQGVWIPGFPAQSCGPVHLPLGWWEIKMGNAADTHHTHPILRRFRRHQHNSRIQKHWKVFPSCKYN